MPHKTKTKGIVLALLTPAMLMAARLALAELTPVSDEELSEVTGQAYISIDKTYHPEQTNLSYTRINLGMDIETKLNADTLELGRYDRSGERSGSSDILINDFGLGYIHNRDFFRNYPYIPSVQKSGGGSYQEGDIVPFKITDPYMEFAFDDDTGQIVGVRLGFGEAMGLMTGDIRSMTGNVNVSIKDYGSGITAAAQRNNNGNLLEKFVVALTPFLIANSPVSTTAELATTSGDPDPVRATHIGMLNGTNFTAEQVPGITAGLVDILSGLGLLTSPVTVDRTSAFGCGFLGLESCNNLNIESQNCKMIGIDTCFPLTNFKTLPIGELSSDKKTIVAPVSGMFLSFQTKDGTPWSTTKNASEATSADDYVNTYSGAFFNVPNGVVEVNLDEVYRGTPAVRQEFIDRGRGLF